MKRYGKYGRKASWIIKSYGKYGRKSWTVIRYGNYERKASRIVKRHDKYGRKVANIEMIWKIWKKSKLKC